MGKTFQHFITTIGGITTMEVIKWLLCREVAEMIIWVRIRSVQDEFLNTIWNCVELNLPLQKKIVN